MIAGELAHTLSRRVGERGSPFHIIFFFIAMQAHRTSGTSNLLCSARRVNDVLFSDPHTPPKFRLHLKLNGVTLKIHLYEVIFNLCGYFFKNFKHTNAKVVLWGILDKTSLCSLGFICVNVGTYGKLHYFTT